MSDQTDFWHQVVCRMPGTQFSLLPTCLQLWTYNAVLPPGVGTEKNGGGEMRGFGLANSPNLLPHGLCQLFSELLKPEILS